MNGINRFSNSLGSLILFGPLPPPVNGHTLAFKMFVESLKKRGVDGTVVNYTRTLFPNNNLFLRPFIRLIDYTIIFKEYLSAVLRAPKGVVYFTPNQAVSGVFRDILIIFFAKMAGHKVVAHIKGGYYDVILSSLPKNIQSLAVNALRRCNSIIILSERLKSMFKDFPQLQPLLRVVTNGLPMPAPSDVLPKTIDPNGPIRLLFMSNMMESKGWWELLNAIERLVNVHKICIHATFCGPFLGNADDKRFKSPRQAQEAFERLQTKLNNHSDGRAKIEWLQLAHGETKEKLLREAHFLILPSRYPNEGQPLVLIEGLAFGCVLIGTDYRAIGDMVRPEVSGYLLPPDCQPETIADCIAKAVSNPAEFQRLSAGAIDLYQREFTTERHIDKMLEVLFSS